MENDKPVVKPILAQLSPTVSPLSIDGNNIQLGDNVSVAATSDGKDNAWLYTVFKMSVAQT